TDLDALRICGPAAAIVHNWITLSDQEAHGLFGPPAIPSARVTGGDIYSQMSDLEAWAAYGPGCRALHAGVPGAPRHPAKTRVPGTLVHRRSFYSASLLVGLRRESKNGPATCR
ncbi:MAG: hypothetical protein ACE5EF_03790, partial [Dehalococcoidia bacterium]